MLLWYRRVSEAESETRWSEKCPGGGWYQLDRALRDDEVVTLNGDKAAIVKLDTGEQQKPDPRALLAAALPDILLAVADGADLKDEIRKVLAASKDTNEEITT